MSEVIKRLAVQRLNTALAAALEVNTELREAARALDALWSLEAQIPAAAERASESSSPEAIERPAETKPTWSTSKTWSSRVRADGRLESFPQQDISDWLSFLRILGSVREVEIGVTLTSKGATPPSGSDSPSIEVQASSVSGAPGTDALPESSSRAGRELEESLDMVLAMARQSAIELDHGHTHGPSQQCDMDCMAQHYEGVALGRVQQFRDSLSSPHQSATSPAGSDEWEPKDAEDFWVSLNEQQKEWAREAVEATSPAGSGEESVR